MAIRFVVSFVLIHLVLNHLATVVDEAHKLPVSNQINLYFSEQMDPMSLENVAAYNLDPTIGQPILATAVAPHYQEVRLVFDTDITTNQIYELNLAL